MSTDSRERGRAIDGFAEPRYGFPAKFWRALETRRPPGLDESKLWRSPLRGPWFTSVLSLGLLIGLPLLIGTGLLSYIAYGPQFGQALPAHVGWLHLPWFAWPARPSWLYQLNQGLHVDLGFVLIPLLLAKLWSVLPKLFVWPQARSLTDVVNRLSLGLLVGSVLFEFVTGVLNVQYDYVFGFDFYTAHYFGAWVFIGALVAHVAMRLPRMIRGLRSRSLRAELRASRELTTPEAPDDDGLAATAPAAPTISRRGALGLVGGGMAAIAVLTVGQSIGGPARRLALLLPRGRSLGNGPNAFQVNKTAAAAGISAAQIGPAWRLKLIGATKSMTLDRAALLALPQHQATLPIACVEGWSTTQTWGGVRLRDLARLVGVADPSSAHVRSIQRFGGFTSATLEAGQVRDSDALLALQVNGADLSPDHGLPARIIVPALPGVHNTKWVGSIEFRSHD